MTIWIRTGLSQTERRCVLAHELVHIRHHHTSHQPAAVERTVRAETARWLIPDLHLIRDALCMPDPAAELWVTPSVFRDRLASLTDDERSRITYSLDPAN
nr:ImmA/IrrE family metallo-endopeptidase [Acidipropionibacterium jensenii]